MGEVPLSLHVDAKLKEKLESEARRQKVSADDLADAPSRIISIFRNAIARSCASE